MVTRRWFALLFLALAAFAPRALVGQTVCLPFASACRTNVITGPNTVFLDASRGGTFTLGTKSSSLFSLAGPIAVWVRPATAGPSGGLLTGAVALCGSGVAGLMAGSATCTVTRGGSLSIAIPQALVDTLLQRGPGIASPKGFWLLYAMNTRTGVEAPLPHTIRFLPAGSGGGGPAPNPAPYISDFSVSPSSGGHPKCVPENDPDVTINVQGQNFDASARIIVSYIYFVKGHTFVTDFHGQDSRVGASMNQQTPTYLSGSVNLQFIHKTGGDNFGTLGGNYYVQVQNGGGQTNALSPNYFTVLPYGGGDSRCL